CAICELSAAEERAYASKNGAFRGFCGDFRGAFIAGRLWALGRDCRRQEARAELAASDHADEAADKAMRDELVDLVGDYVDLNRLQKIARLGEQPGLQRAQEHASGRAALYAARDSADDRPIGHCAESFSEQRGFQRWQRPRLFKNECNNDCKDVPEPALVPEASEEAQARWVCEGEGVVADIGVSVEELQVVIALGHRIGAQEAAEGGIVEPGVEVDET
ncbi:MAG TPA: hypothetical protein VHC42_00425, partial [Rhizomicrobium sp.]|nr:hypothetical protein [Rhizomicrobium sp.]